MQLNPQFCLSELRKQPFHIQSYVIHRLFLTEFTTRCLRVEGEQFVPSPQAAAYYDCVIAPNDSFCQSLRIANNWFYKLSIGLVANYVQLAAYWDGSNEVPYVPKHLLFRNLQRITGEEGVISMGGLRALDYRYFNFGNHYRMLRMASYQYRSPTPSMSKVGREVRIGSHTLTVKLGVVQDGLFCFDQNTPENAPTFFDNFQELFNYYV